jgi:hypothetical protein
MKDDTLNLHKIRIPSENNKTAKHVLADSVYYTDLSFYGFS